MIFRKGDYIVYRNSEICVVGDRAEMCLRPVLAKEKLLEIIDSMPKIEGSWINDKNLRIDSFGDAVKSGDYSLILPMMNAIYNERKKRAEQGKHIPSADERAFNSAKHLLHSEIAYSLGIAPDMVEQFIEDRINKY